MFTPDIRTITDTAIRHARASDQYAKAVTTAAIAGFTLDATPRRSDDRATLTLPRDRTLPDQLLEQLVALAAHLRGRAMDGTCTPITIHVHPKAHAAPN